ncbi:methyl-accepting chemotaxis protein [Aquisalimonas sp. APHAB1-3]|uniref:methyl-accepting chemotaxis protein n=1 Tax=Aquisalimonas sp. APHAB1-3 TaxID=3402080 RepID=UPI003AADCA28
MKQVTSGGLAARLGFAGRLTVMIVSLVLVSIVLITSLVYVQYRDSQTEAVLNDLYGTGDANTQAFMDWLTARQDEMRYLASLSPAEELDVDALNHLLERIAESQGHYDTIFVVGEDGHGISGVAYDGQAEVLSADEAHDFHVADRAWFQAAIGGDDVFSEPLVSRATGNRVSNVVIPIRNNGQVVGVMRGAVQLDTIVEQVEDMADDRAFEVYLVDGNGEAVTNAPSIDGVGSQVDTEAVRGLDAGESGVGVYPNAAGQQVAGSYSPIPLLDWGLVMEVPETEALAEVRRIFWILSAIATVILIISILASLGIVRSITRPLGGEPRYAAQAVHRVADGDMATPIELRPGDTDSLLASIANMQENLRTMIREMSNYADEVASAATELTQVNQETDRGIQEQRDQLSSAATAMTEMTATVEEVARNSQSAADGANNTSSEAHEGHEVVTKTMTAMNTLSGQIGETADMMATLKQESDNVGTVLQVIEDVAEQTNLLALNAAIEAARAGDHGRGFAVVADEVRSLATRTKDSTNEIQSIIEQVQASAGRAEQSMQQSREYATESVGQAEHAGESLGRITGAVANINEMIQQIASAAEEQSATAKEINENIHNITQVADDNARSVVQSTEASESMSQLAEKLRQITHQFRL